MKPAPFIFLFVAFSCVADVEGARDRSGGGGGRNRDRDSSAAAAQGGPGLARISSAHYGSFCTPIIAVCDPRFECIDNKCVCPSIKHQVYDKESGGCRSLVGGPCSIASAANSGSNSVAASASARICVPNAVCTNKGYYEACECAANYVENSEGGCSLGVGSACGAGGADDSAASTCDSSLICRNGKCDCADELEVYDFLKKKCRGVVGAACDPSAGGGEEDYCVEKATCRVANAKLRGRCACINAWDEWSDRFCERFDDVAAHDPYGEGPRYQTTEDPRQRLRQGASTTPSPSVPNYGGRYYRRRGRSIGGGSPGYMTTTTPEPPTTTGRQYGGGGGGWPRERTTPAAVSPPPTTTRPSFSLRSSATQPTRPSWSYPAATPTLATFGNGGGGGYVPENCPKQEISDCMYEDCKLTGCTDGKICCPKPCGGSWCVRGIR